MSQTRSSTERRFVLQFPPSELAALAERYGYDEDVQAFAAGKNILGGDYSVANLKIVIEWKSQRIAGLIEKNSQQDVAKALKFATDPRTSERSAIEVLCNLTGVGLPVASAILTMVFPEKYTIVDFRALEALGVNNGKELDTVDYYLDYLNFCRAIAQLHRISLRNLDRALWQWSKERGSSGDCG